MRRRSWIILLTALIAIGLAIPVSAAPPLCSENPNHPKCVPDDPGEPPAEELPLSGTVCDPSDYPEGIEGVQSNDFTFTLSGKQDGACIDVVSVEGPWEVTITGEGARYLGIIPRDSIGPGDSCGGYLLRSEANIYGMLTLGYDGSIPAATINACGTDFGEWVDIGLEGLDPRLVADDDGGGDCAAIEGDFCFVTERLVDVVHPLVLQAFLSGSADGTTTIEVVLP